MPNYFSRVDNILEFVLILILMHTYRQKAMHFIVICIYKDMHTIYALGEGGQLAKPPPPLPVPVPLKKFRIRYDPKTSKGEGKGAPQQNLVIKNQVNF